MVHEFDADSIALAMWALSSIDGVDESLIWSKDPLCLCLSPSTRCQGRVCKNVARCGAELVSYPICTKFR